ncbi:MAG: SulP family inorganic anion transporter [Bacteroidia bacterium]|nr:SulP family inorganic anion transporter [Bacteroidia bacterium]MDW8236300.1 SulP family inorganic anion transporter [Bacteroidia bacterium]
MRTTIADIGASLVVYLVAIPLSIGIAIASGIPMEDAAGKGLMAAAVGGIVGGLMGGSPLLVSGPAAGLAIIVSIIISQLGPQGMWAATFLAGVLQIVAGIMRLGPFFRATSPALIQGMLSGIGLLILFSQAHVMAGVAPPGTGQKWGGLKNLFYLPSTFYQVLYNKEVLFSVIVGALTIGVVWLWSRTIQGTLKLIPGQLVAVIVAAIGVYLFHWPVDRIQLPPELLHHLDFPDRHFWGQLGRVEVWIEATILAFVASTESLLTGTAMDTLQSHASRTRYNLVLVGDGIANILCGVMGLLPVAGVVVRSSANVYAGAQTRLSAVLHGVWILITLELLPDVLSYLPLPALAAILVYVGVQLLGIQHMEQLWRTDKGELLVFFVTMAGVILFNLFAGIVMGLLVSLLYTLYKLSELKIKENPLPTGEIELYFFGVATFLQVPQLARKLEGLDPGMKVYLRLEGLKEIDYACREYLKNWKKQYQKLGGEVRGLKFGD